LLCLGLSTAAHAGGNKLVVRVANNWVNRLVGDANLPEPARAAKTNVLTTGANPVQRWREVKLRDSGLLGPVRLTVEPAVR
jgi:hypothetical protein